MLRDLRWQMSYAPVAGNQAADVSGSPTTSIPDTTSDTDYVTPQTPLHVAVHLTPKAVADDPRYRAWMESCGSGTQHIMANVVAPGKGAAMMRSSAAIHAKLNLMAPTLFPLALDSSPQPADTGAFIDRAAAHAAPEMLNEDSPSS